MKEFEEFENNNYIIHRISVHEYDKLERAKEWCKKNIGFTIIPEGDGYVYFYDHARKTFNFYFSKEWADEYLIFRLMGF